MEMTLNMLRKTHVNPKISAFKYLQSQFSYDAVPVLPFEWKMVCFEDPAIDEHRHSTVLKNLLLGCVHMGIKKIQAYIPSINVAHKTNTFAVFAPS